MRVTYDMTVSEVNFFHHTNRTVGLMIMERGNTYTSKQLDELLRDICHMFNDDCDIETVGANRPHLGAVSLKITYFGNVAEYQLYLR